MDAMQNQDQKRVGTRIVRASNDECDKSDERALADLPSIFPLDTQTIPGAAMRIIFFLVCLSLLVSYRTGQCQILTHENGKSKPRFGIGIPLERIWTCGMNGADTSIIDVRRVGDVVSSPLTDAIRKALYNSDEAPSGFAVQGVNMAALKSAHDVFVDGKEPVSELRANQGVSVVFFTHFCYNRVRLQKVTYDGKTVEIDYYFEHPRAWERYAAFALIPLPNPRPGNIDVRFRVDTEMTSADVYKSIEHMESCVCKPFTFRIL